MSSWRLHKLVFICTMVVVPVVIAATLAGLLVEELYGNMSDSLRAQARGQDLVTLVFVIPLMVWALITSFKGSVYGSLVLLGLHAYLFYTYLMFSVGIDFNVMFIGYVAIYAGAIISIATMLTSLDINELKSLFSDDMPNRAISVYLLVSSVGIFVLWMGSIVIPATIAGELPPGLLEESGGNLFVQAMDLGLIFPIGLASGILLWKKSKWAYLLTSVFLVKAMTLLLAILGMIAVMHNEGVPASIIHIIFFTTLFLVGVVMFFLFFRSLNSHQDT